MGTNPIKAESSSCFSRTLRWLSREGVSEALFDVLLDTDVAVLAIDLAGDFRFFNFDFETKPAMVNYFYDF